MDFSRIDYLQTGNPRQRSAYEWLRKYEVMEHLAPYHPLLAGTLPIEIDLETSDLDIICCAENLGDLERELRVFFGHFPDFTVSKPQIRQQDCLMAAFRMEEFPVEIFAQNTPSHRQYAYRHLLIEYRILEKEGPEFRQKIIALKRQGVKTEPAFCQVLGIPGDPYEALLALEEAI